VWARRIPRALRFEDVSGVDFATSCAGIFGIGPAAYRHRLTHNAVRRVATLACALGMPAQAFLASDAANPNEVKVARPRKVSTLDQPPANLWYLKAGRF
jgi:hypothetical protein